MGVSNVVNDLVLSNGLFTVTLDFGAAAFPGNDRWLDIAVRPGTSSGAYTALTPRQPITSTPYALRAANLTGTLPQSQLPTGVITNNRTGVTLSGTFTGNGAALSNVNAMTLNGITSAGFWRTDGNVGANPASGAFIGSADNQALEFKVNGARALRLEPDLTSPNILAGSPANAKIGGIVGAAVLGGGNASYPNTVANNYATVVGGISNTASGSASLAMGQFNTASGYAAVASGYGSTAAGFTSFAGGQFSASGARWFLRLGRQYVCQLFVHGQQPVPHPRGRRGGHQYKQPRRCRAFCEWSGRDLGRQSRLARWRVVHPVPRRLWRQLAHDQPVSQRHRQRQPHGPGALACVRQLGFAVSGRHGPV